MLTAVYATTPAESVNVSTDSMVHLAVCGTQMPCTLHGTMASGNCSPIHVFPLFPCISVNRFPVYLSIVSQTFICNPSNDHVLVIDPLLLSIIIVLYAL